MNVSHRPIHFGAAKPRIAQIDINGEIDADMRTPAHPFMAKSGPDRSLTGNVIKAIEKVEQDCGRGGKRAPAGVLVTVNSPGGVGGASEEIFNGIQYIRDDLKIPVVTSMRSVAASGGLAVSMPGNFVVAMPSTATGSIGSRLDLTSESGGESLTSGKFKAIDLAAIRKERKARRKAGEKGLGPLEQHLKDYLDAGRDEFVGWIVKGRNGADTDAGKALTREKVLEIADGKVFTGRQAHAYGLVDELGDTRFALSYLKNMIGATEAEVIQYVKEPPPGLLRRLIR